MLNFFRKLFESTGIHPLFLIMVVMLAATWCDYFNAKGKDTPPTYNYVRTRKDAIRNSIFLIVLFTAIYFPSG